MQSVSRSSIRAERALATRRRMVTAAYDLFCSHGYLGTTISAVAEGAGVAVPTVYYTFGTKAALLGESLGAAVVGFDLWRRPPAEPIGTRELLRWNPWWSDFEAAPTSADALEVFVRQGVHILGRVGPLIPAMHAASGEPEAAEVVRVGEQRRVDAYREAIAVLARKPGGLRPGLPEAEATDLLVVLFSADVHRALAMGRGWSTRRCVGFFGDILRAQLLGDPP
jgi:AcrR family transcriptional regulator